MNNNLDSNRSNTNIFPLNPHGNNHPTTGFKLPKFKLREFEELADKAIDLLLYNKINSKNAFDVDNAFLEQLPMILNQEEEASWQRASATLDASAKIYGYRVDSVHTDMFKFLGGLNRTEFHQDAVSSKKKKREDIDINNGDKTIEKDITKLDLTSYDLEFSVDPLFKNMTANFNQTGVNRLLFKILPLNENLDILFESNDNENEQIHTVKKTQFSEQTNRIVEECVERVDSEEIRKMSICCDLSLFKTKYQLENPYRVNSLLDELLSEEDKDFIMEEAPKDLYEEEEENSLPNEEQNDENILKDNEEVENMDNKELFNEDKQEENELVVELNNEELQNENLEKKDVKSDWKTYLLNFGDGNVNLLKDFSQGGQFKTNFLKNKNKSKSILKVNKNEQKSSTKNKENTLFDFNLEKIPKKSDIYKHTSRESNKNDYDLFLGKKRKMLNVYHIESSLSFHYFMTDIMQIRKDIRRKIKPHSYMNNSMNEDKFLDDPNFDDEYADEGEEDNNFIKGNKMKNRLFNGKFGKLYRSFNLQVLKNKMWDLLQKLFKSNKKKDSLNDSANEVYFNNFMSLLDKEYENDHKDKISRQTCFVCLLHLANEKSLVLEEVNSNNFKIILNGIERSLR